MAAACTLHTSAVVSADACELTDLFQTNADGAVFCLLKILQQRPLRQLDLDRTQQPGNILGKRTCHKARITTKTKKH